MSSDSKKQKKPYTKPKLTVYGNTKTITQTTMSGNTPDGGVNPNHKTGN